VRARSPAGHVADEARGRRHGGDKAIRAGCRASPGSMAVGAMAGKRVEVEEGAMGARKAGKGGLQKDRSPAPGPRPGRGLASRPIGGLGGGGDKVAMGGGGRSGGEDDGGNGGEGSEDDGGGDGARARSSAGRVADETWGRRHGGDKVSRAGCRASPGSKAVGAVAGKRVEVEEGAMDAGGRRRAWRAAGGLFGKRLDAKLGDIQSSEARKAGGTVLAVSGDGVPEPKPIFLPGPARFTGRAEVTRTIAPPAGKKLCRAHWGVFSPHWGVLCELCRRCNAKRQSMATGGTC